MVGFIDDHRETFGVEPICAMLLIALSREAASGDAAVYGRAAEPAVGRPPDVRRHLARLRVRGVRHRRVLASDRRLAASTSPRSDLALDALEQALYDRPLIQAEPLVHHSDRGVQYLSIQYTERLAQAGVEPSVEARGTRTTTRGRKR